MSKEATKLALEAVYETIIQWDEGGGKRSRRELARRIVALAEQPYPDNFIHALMYDVARRDSEEHNDKTDWQERGMVAEAALAKLLDEKDEPVAVVSGYYGGQCVILPIDPARIFNSNMALYTSPPAQRKPLTDEQREEIAKGWRGRNWTVGDIIDATEAAHGIKENT